VPIVFSFLQSDGSCLIFGLGYVAMMMAIVPAMHQKMRKGTGGHNEEREQRNSMLPVSDGRISTHKNGHTQQVPAAVT
jgi:hypothetical protein